MHCANEEDKAKHTFNWRYAIGGMKILSDIEVGTNQICVSLMRLFKVILMKL